jgi:hypothetical protein
MKDITKLGIAALGALAIVGAVYLVTGRQPPPSNQAAAPAAPAAAPATAPAEHYPVPPSAQAEAVPQPGTPEAEQAARGEIESLFGQQAARRLFRLDKLINPIVVTVDNLAREKAAARLLPTQPVPGRFIVSKGAQGLTIAPENARRYAPYVRLLEQVDTGQLAAAYVRLYPLFQHAYEELGYPHGYFNDRLVAVIDHLLAAPEPEGPLRLIQPHVLYQYEDARLEAASAGHKIMLRIGIDNERRVKRKLRELRQQLVALAPR